MSSKKILFGHTARNKMLDGARKVADIVSQTMGPCGSTVVIESSYGAPRITKDGVTVAKEVNLCCNEEKIGADILKQAALKSNEAAGDGTTTTVVFGFGLLSAGLRLIDMGHKQRDVINGIKDAENIALKEIATSSKKISTQNEIKNVATLSANGDNIIGTLLTEATDKVGKDGIVTIEQSKTSEDDLKVVQGFQFDRGYVSPYFINNSEKMSTEFEKPLILVTDKKISNIKPILHILESVVSSSRPLLLIADDVDGEALSVLIVNKFRGLNVCAVKAPGFGDRRKAMLEDIAILTGSTFISDDLGVSLDKITMEDLGSAEKVTITKDDTVIVAGNLKDTRQSAIEDRCLSIKAQIEASTSEYDKEKLKERLGKLTGGVAVIYVGGSTEIEIKERKDRFEDALNAVKAASKEGIVQGGGIAMLNLIPKIEKALISKNNSESYNAGVKAFIEALKSPIKTIISNSANEDPVLVIDHLKKLADPNITFNAVTGEYVDAYKAGIIDPAYVVMMAIKSGSSIAINIIGSNGSIVEDAKNKKETNQPQLGNGGYGDMDM